MKVPALLVWLTLLLAGCRRSPAPVSPSSTPPHSFRDPQLQAQLVTWLAARDGVIEVSLAWKKLRRVPLEIFALHRLEVLSLAHNSLTSLPAEIGQLRSLRALDLAGNDLRTLPAELSLLEGLEELRLDEQCDLATGANVDILARLPKLRRLSLRRCQVGPGIAKLSRLEELDVSGGGELDDVRGTFEILGRLPSLQTLNVDGRALTALPDNVAKLRQLRSLQAGRYVTELPRSVASLEHLQRLVLFGDSRTGSATETNPFPPQIFAASHLVELRYSGTFEAVPDRFEQMPALEVLGLSSRHLRALPPSIGRLRRLRELDVANCDLAEIPSWLYELPALESLSVSFNRRLGKGMPAMIANPALRKVKSLSLQGMGLTVLPPEIAKLSDLRELSLGSNDLGTVPEALRSLRNLWRLDLSQTELTGLPSWIEELPQLRNLAVHGNRDLPATDVRRAQALASRGRASR